MTAVDVSVQLPSGTEIPAGVLREEPSPTGGAPFVSFRYHAEYLAAPGSYALSPELHLDTGLQRPPVHRPMFLGFEDAGPDRWGRDLLQEEERLLARHDGRPYGRLSALDSLLRVSDSTRQGAIRFWSDGAPLGRSALPDRVDTVDWPRLLAAAADAEAGRNVASALEILFQFGSASPGGARPKVQVTDDSGSLWLAKLPAHGDRWDVSLWEEVTLTLAARAGIRVPPHRLERVGEGRSILLVRRFDREDGRRIGYRSARTLLQLDDHEIDRRSYTDLAGALRRTASTEDVHELFRRVAFTLLVGNLDDHMRNHGLLRTKTGWRLSPMFDVNPHWGSGFDSTPIVPSGPTRRREIHELLDVADAFDLSTDTAMTILREVEYATRDWAATAIGAGAEQENLEPFAALFDGPARDWVRNR